MKYLCLVYLSKESWSACPDGKCFEFADGLQKSGRLLAAEPLHPVDTATTVRVRNGQMSLTDGPFAETKEMLAGFYLVDAKDLNEAVQIAAQIPPSKYGSIEVRPVRELDLTSAHTD
ncbi:MAG: YciI family protein [Burkholderiales bacterium]